MIDIRKVKKDGWSDCCRLWGVNPAFCETTLTPFVKYQRS